MSHLFWRNKYSAAKKIASASAARYAGSMEMLPIPGAYAPGFMLSRAPRTLACSTQKKSDAGISVPTSDL
jgi:hypothetical protein